MDPAKLADGARSLPFSKQSQKSMDGKEKCIHGNEKGMGCCGYDELAVKPATTTPITFGSRPQVRVAPKEDIEMGERPRIQAKPMPSSDIQMPYSNQPVPVQPGMGGRIPDGNFGVGSQVRSIFDVQQKGSGPQVSNATPRQRVVAKVLGQEAPPEAPSEPPPPEPTPAPSPERVEAILKRETPPEGLVKVEAGELGLALTPAIENSSLALAEGEQCLGVDSSSLKKAAGLRDGLLKFANTAPESSRLVVEPDDLTLMEQVLECSALYEARKSADVAKTVAFVAGGLLVGAVVLVLASG